MPTCADALSAHLDRPCVQQSGAGNRRCAPSEQAESSSNEAKAPSVSRVQILPAADPANTPAQAGAEPEPAPQFEADAVDSILQHEPGNLQYVQKPPSLPMQPSGPAEGAPAAPAHADSSTLAHRRNPPSDGDAAAVSVAQRELGNAVDTTADLDERLPVQSQDIPASESPSPAGDAPNAATAAASSDQHDAAAVVRFREALSSGAPAADAQLLAAPGDGAAPGELQLHQPMLNGCSPDSASAAAKASDVAAPRRQLPEGNVAAATAPGTAQEGLDEATNPAAGHASAELRSEQGSTHGTPSAGEAQDDDSTTARSRGGSSAASAAASLTAASATIATAGAEARFGLHPLLLLDDTFTAQRGCCSAARSEATPCT